MKRAPWRKIVAVGMEILVAITVILALITIVAGMLSMFSAKSCAQTPLTLHGRPAGYGPANSPCWPLGVASPACWDSATARTYCGSGSGEIRVQVMDLSDTVDATVTLLPDVGCAPWVAYARSRWAHADGEYERPLRYLARRQRTVDGVATFAGLPVGDWWVSATVHRGPWIIPTWEHVEAEDFHGMPVGVTARFWTVR